MWEKIKNTIDIKFQSNIVRFMLGTLNILFMKCETLYFLKKGLAFVGLGSKFGNEMVRRLKRW